MTSVEIADAVEREEAEAAARWLAGPAALVTADESERMRAASEAGLLPMRQMRMGTR